MEIYWVFGSAVVRDMTIEMGNSSQSAEPIAPNAVKIKAEIDPDVTEASKEYVYFFRKRIKLSFILL